MEQEYRSVDLIEFFRLIKQNLVFMIIMGLLFGVFSFLICEFAIAPQYEAKTSLVVLSNKSQDQKTDITNDQITTAKQLVNTYALILTSDTVLEKVIESLQLQDTTTKSLAKQITAAPINQTQVMELVMKDTNPVKAQAVLEEIVAMAPDILAETINAGSVSVISVPKANSTPVSPNKPILTILGTFLGVVFAFLIGLLRKLLKNTFTSDTDIQKELDLPVLGVIPKID